jgi:phosphoglycolate phosphatase
VTSIDELVSVLRRTSAVLLDFDGPVCSMFAGYPAAQITAELRALAVERVGRHIPALADATGPHELLAAAGAVSVHLAQAIEDALQVAEIKAAESATPTPGAAEFLAACQNIGRPVAVVSNNCLPAVEAYLQRVGLAGTVQHVEARDPDDPARMKPSPYLVERAAHAIGAPLPQCVLIGDQPTDIEAARAVGAASIGYANKPGKDLDLEAAGADAITSRMDDLAQAVRAT